MVNTLDRARVNLPQGSYSERPGVVHLGSGPGGEVPGMPMPSRKIGNNLALTANKFLASAQNQAQYWVRRGIK